MHTFFGGDLYAKGNVVSGISYVNNSLSIGNGSGVPPTYSLQVTGNANITSTLFVNGNLGVGTITPTYTLDVSGNIHSSCGLIVNGNVAINKTSSSFALDVSDIAVVAAELGTTYPSISNLTNAINNLKNQVKLGQITVNKQASVAQNFLNMFINKFIKGK